MSENTNTLFWVITGAVIVLAVFLLINNSQDNTLTSISNEFNSLWTGEEKNTNMGNNDEVEEDYRYISNNENVSFIKLGENTGNVLGLEVKITGLPNNTSQYPHITWYIKNTTNKSISGTVRLLIYDYDTNRETENYYWPFTNLSPNSTINLTSGLNHDFPERFYCKLVFE